MRFALEIAALAVLAGSLAASASTALRLEKAIPLPGLEGRLGAMAVDAKTGRVFVPAIHSDAIDVVDVRQGRRVYTIKGHARPTSVLYEYGSGRLLIATRTKSSVSVLDGTTYKVLHVFSVPRPPEYLAYSLPAKALLVAHAAGISMYDLAGKSLGDIRLDSPPGAIHADPNSSRVFINLPLTKSVAVADIISRAVRRNWPITDETTSGQNYAFAFDHKNRRMFVGTRRPGRLIVLSTDSGTRILTGVIDRVKKQTGVVQEADRQTVADVESISFDPANGRIYLTGSDPFIDVVTQASTAGYTSGGRVPTTQGARTSVLLPELGRFCVAVPGSAGKPAELRVFEVMK
jgi:DNA-binding beta-propeller fold protein YncE